MMFERHPIWTLILGLVGAMAFGVLALWLWFTFGFLISIGIIVLGVMAAGWIAQRRARSPRHG